MIVRDATALDVGALVALVIEFAAVAYPNDAPSPEHIRGVIQGAMSNEGSLVAVLEGNDGSVQGCFMGARIQNMISGQSTAVEVLFYVRPDKRGHGARLLAFAEQWAEDRGCKAMYLSCPASAVRAARYFEAKGYKLTECHFGKVL